MMIFAGKLLVSKDRDRQMDKVDSSAHAQKFALKTLSQQEKLLLVELQKTRASIVNELEKMDPTSCGNNDNWFQVQSTKEGYEQKILDASKPYSRPVPMKISKSVKARRQLKPLANSSMLMMSPTVGGGGPIKLSTFKTGIDMLPIMANTGDAALEVGLKKQGKLHLPVFKLPSLETTQYKKRMVNGTVVHVKIRPKSAARTAVVQVANRGLVYRNQTEFLKAVAVMHEKMSAKELAFMQKHLQLSEQGLTDVGADIELSILLQAQEEADKEAKRRRRESKVTSAGNDESLDATNINSSRSSILGQQITKRASEESSDDEINTDKSSQPPSLFMRAAQMDRIQRRTVVASLSHTSTTSFVPQMSDTSPQRPNLHAMTVPSTPNAGNMSITSEFEYSQQPAMMIRQMRSMPTMPTAKFHSHDHPDDDEDISQHTFTTPKKQQQQHATVALGVGLASAIKSGVGGSSINHRHSHNDIDAILSTPSGRNHQHNNTFQTGGTMYTSNTTMKAANNDNTNNKRSRSSAQDMNSIRDAYGTNRRGGKKLVGSKNTIPAWSDTPTDPQQAAAHNISHASNALKAELMKSLQSMQQHTEMVKDNILNVQHIVDVGTGTKAKSFMLAMAAERLAKSLYTCIRKELRRGWRAWILAVRQEERKVIVDAYIRFQGLRYLAKALKWLMHVALIKKWVKWVAYARDETMRLRDILEHDAAIVIQTRARGMITRIRVTHIKRMKKYEHLYHAVIELQRWFRGKPIRWRYLRYLRHERKRKSATKIQSIVRMRLGFLYVRNLRYSLDKSYAATKINSIVRMYLAKFHVQQIRIYRIRLRATIRIQSVVRGFLGRCHVNTILRDLEQFYAARMVQTQVRIFIAKRFIIKKRIETHAYWRMRTHSAVLIQKTYRGYRGRLKAYVITMEINRKRRRVYGAATKIINMCRGYVARKKLARFKVERFNRWLAQARIWKEMWSEDANDWFYYNEETKDSVWEPTKLGYTKADSRLVLEDGSVIFDPEVEALKDAESTRMPKDMCSECGERYAIRACKECGDAYCTPCYKSAHATGTRKKHVYVPVGPVDCGECENLLAERWCVTCDEAHCDVCWRKLHARGKRRFHPFCKVWPGGKIGKEMMTIDGSEIVDNSYDPTFLMRRQEADVAAQSTSTEFNYTYPEGEVPGYDQTGYGQAGNEYPQVGYDGNADYNAGGDGTNQWGNQEPALAIENGPKSYDPNEWQTAYDEEGNAYYYNTITGVSQYEDPQSQDPEAEYLRSQLEQWAQAYDEEGNVYWYNSVSGVSQYENPFATTSDQEGVPAEETGATGEYGDYDNTATPYVADEYTAGGEY